MAIGGHFCYVDGLANAQAIAGKLNQQGVLHVYPHAYKVIQVEVVPMSEAPDEAIRRLSDFLRTEANMPRTKTVEFRGLPRQTVSAIHEMSERCFEFAKNMGLDEWNFPLGDPNHDTNPRVVKIEGSLGDSTVRFSSESAAKDMVSMYNGSFWKNGVVYAECVDDSEMDHHFQQGSSGKQTKLFIPKVKPGASKEVVRAVFAPYKVEDIQMQPGKNFAFVFMHQDAATKFMSTLNNPDGKHHNKWFWVIKTDQKKKRGKAAAALPDSKYKVTPASGPLSRDTTDVAYGISHLSIAGSSNEAITDNDGYPSIGGQPWTTQATITHRQTTKVPEVTVAMKTPNNQSPKVTAKIRLSTLPRAATEEHVQKFFEGYPVQEIVLGQGEATVTIMGQAEAEEAQLVLNNNKSYKILGKKMACVLLT